jgi:hypothetical protein
MHVEAKEHEVSRRVLTGEFVWRRLDRCSIGANTALADNHSRGLILSLWYREDDIVLGLRRRNVKPSLKEVEICATTFFFSQPIESRAEKDNTIWIGISKKALYGR